MMIVIITVSNSHTQSPSHQTHNIMGVALPTNFFYYTSIYYVKIQLNHILKCLSLH